MKFCLLTVSQLRESALKKHTPCSNLSWFWAPYEACWCLAFYHWCWFIQGLEREFTYIINQHDSLASSPRCRHTGVTMCSLGVTRCLLQLEQLEWIGWYNKVHVSEQATLLVHWLFLYQLLIAHVEKIPCCKISLREIKEFSFISFWAVDYLKYLLFSVAVYSCICIASISCEFSTVNETGQHTQLSASNTSPYTASFLYPDGINLRQWSCSFPNVKFPFPSNWSHIKFTYIYSNNISPFWVLIIL